MEPGRLEVPLQEPLKKDFQGVSWVTAVNPGFPRLVPVASGLHHFSHVLLSATLWTVALQSPLSMGFSRQEYWSGLLQLFLESQGMARVYL